MGLSSWLTGEGNSWSRGTRIATSAFYNLLVCFKFAFCSEARFWVDCESCTHHEGNTKDYKTNKKHKISIRQVS